MQQVFIGRQPILDANGDLFGYELLCRDEQGRLAIAGNGDRESTVMLLDAILAIGLEKLTKSHRAFINVTETLLLGELIDTLPAANVVLEVLETVQASPALAERLGVLRSRKFTIALDDFVLGPGREALIEHADIVKLDVLQLDDAGIEAHVAAIKKHDCRLLAEKIETREQYERLRALGFDLFQGYYFARPELYSTRTLRPSRLAVLQLLGRVNDPDVSITELAALIRSDVALSMVTTVLVRARTCELLSAALRRANPAGYFTVGLFSALDVMMESPMATLVEQLPLATELKRALLDQSGEHGAALKAVIAVEIGDFAGVRFESMTHQAICQCYVEAVEWADQFIGLAVGR